jgi:hypothetical protein
VILALLLAATPVRIAFLNNAPAASELASLVGPNFQVKSFTSLAQVQTFHPNYVIAAPGNSQPGGSIDEFVPNFKTSLYELTTLYGHPKILLCVAPATTPIGREVTNPLSIQAARECGVATINADDASPLAGAEALYSLIVDWKQAKSGWSVVSADSEETDEGPAKNAIDGDPETYWHTQYSPKTTKYPHEIVVDTGAPRDIGGFRYLPRQDGGTNGKIKRYEFSISLDGTNWNDPIAGEFTNSSSASMVRFKSSAQARYFKLRALSEQSGQPYASIAELDTLPAKFANRP